MAQFVKTCSGAAGVLLLLALSSGPAAAQYFGQNKVQYQTFDFQVLRTDHVDLYYYPEGEPAARHAARLAERWYARLSRLLDHELSGRQPLILYASHPHFQQTNVIGGFIGEGVGGVTESLKRRIAMPVGSGLAATDHVLGHELVHAFQYDILGPNINMPLWFIEGMAEYLSVGSVDAHTAVWLRDAALAEELPRLRDLHRPRYFPYRFGHAFWAYVGGRFGDQAIAQILHEASGPRGGPNVGAPARDPIAIIERVLGVDADQLSAEWHQSIMTTMVRPLGNRAVAAGRRIIEPAHEGELNVGPVLSPDGSQIAFLSSRDRLSIDLYVADATTGQVLRRLITTAADPHFDSLQFITSAGAWNPAGTQLAIAAIRTGRPVIAVVDTATGNRLREIPLPGVDEVFHPAWSPDGRQIAFSGLSGGLSDLFVVDLAAGTVRQLTDDAFTNLQPTWSPDGRRLAFSTDRYSTRLDALAFGPNELAAIDVATGRLERLFAFEGARHIMPQWARDGSLYFIANPDGVPDVYRFDPATRATARLTRLMTGVTGITAESPALSVAADGTRVAVVVYRDGSYEIQEIDADRVRGGEPVPPRATLAAAQLAPAERRAAEVDRLLSTPSFGLTAAALPEAEPYRPRLALDFIGQEFGVATTNAMGSHIAGGVAMMFSDMLGDHVVSSILQTSGTLEDFGGQVGYINRTRRWNWGGFFEQLPYVTGGVAVGVQPVNGQPVIVEQQLRDRQLDRRILGLTAYPFSRARRVEIGGAVRHLTFDRRVETRTFTPAGQLLTERRDRVQLGEPLTLGELTAAFVQDTALYGATGPILGHRSRFEAAPVWGDLQFTQAIADFRHYVMPFTPLTVAGRLLHVGRYGGDADSGRLSPLYVGFPNLVRGYEIGTFDADECNLNEAAGCQIVFDMVGSRLLVAGVELRAPLVGAFTGNLEYGPLPIDLIAFFDTGVAWDQQTRPDGLGGTRPWARSYGAGVRVNALGYLVLELAAVRPLDRPRDAWRFVFGIRPGY